jgi:peptidoglycan/LPS O-acetylase OafA/YrhL
MENSAHKYFPEIDVVRSAAFLLVAIVHFSVPTWTDGIHDPNLFERIIMSVIKTGWIGVPLFLFVSGYSLAINKTGRDYKLNTKQFFFNRVLRIFPIWLACIFLLKWSHKLTGANFYSLLLLNVQDIPPASAFGISWSIQLEFFCYLLFPMLLSYLNDLRHVALIYLTLLAFKALLVGVPAQMAWELTYSSVFGATTIFLSGMLARRFVESNSPRKQEFIKQAPWIISFGIILLVAMVHFITINGGWQGASGRKMTFFYLLFPEFCSIIFALITVPYFLLGSVRKKPMSIIGKAFAHIGRVSYSAYMFSLFVLDFVQAFLKHFELFSPGGWVTYVITFLFYLPILIAFSTLTFHTIEKPFLSKRKKY